MNALVKKVVLTWILNKDNQATVVSWNSRPRPFPGMKASDFRYPNCGNGFLIPFLVPNFGNIFIPVPEL